MVSRKSS